MYSVPFLLQQFNECITFQPFLFTLFFMYWSQSQGIRSVEVRTMSMKFFINQHIIFIYIHCSLILQKKPRESIFMLKFVMRDKLRFAISMLNVSIHRYIMYDTYVYLHVLISFNIFIFCTHAQANFSIYIFLLPNVHVDLGWC